MEEAKKADAGKPQLDLLPREGLEQIARVLEYGARKYQIHNYKKGRAWRRDAGAILRHVFAWLDGEDLDPESGLSHLAHAGCGVLFLLEYLKTHPELDNRREEIVPTREKKPKFGKVLNDPLPTLPQGWRWRELSKVEKEARQEDDYFFSELGSYWMRTNLNGPPIKGGRYVRLEKA